MPNFNQTGPNGQGPMTGRRMGRCTGNIPENENSIRTAEARPGTSENAPPAESINQPVGMGMARRRGFGGGGGRGRGGFGRGRGRGRL
jgi:hypothetical protein